MLKKKDKKPSSTVFTRLLEKQILHVLKQKELPEGESGERIMAGGTPRVGLGMHYLQASTLPWIPAAIISPGAAGHAQASSLSLGPSA